ncbi:MAG: transcriptional regulator NrdR [Candidatus Orphnella occulta]|nr:transcriptional regulator NrdR [Candidatus Orphnella occulta]MDP8297120.1 transcriptional regulator NrdR [Candidatus Orphnella occulta]
MRCPYCGYKEDKVVDSRASSENDSIRRRRECLKCQRRFTTYEHIEDMALMVVKKDGQRQAFDRNKLISGILKSCEKRPVSANKIERLVDDVERTLQRKHEKEVQSSQIGGMVMKKLHGLDEVAYVRFASVYREFKDVTEFMKELKYVLAKPR